MQENEEAPLKKVIEELMKSYRWEEKLDTVRVRESWERVVGKIFAKHTTRLYLKDKVLYVSLDSSVLRNELHMARLKIVKMISEELGSEVIQEVVLR